MTIGLYDVRFLKHPMSKPPAKELESIESQLEELEKIGDSSSKIVKSGNYVIKNNSVEDRDEAISGLKRVSEVLENAIGESFKFATDSDQPKAYEILAKLAKEYGSIAQVTMDIHQGTPSTVKPVGKDGVPTDHNQVTSTSMKEILDNLDAIETEE